MKKNFFGDEGQHTAMEKVLAGATFVQIYLSNQLLKEQDIIVCSITDKSKVMTMNGVSLSLWRLAIKHCIAAKPWANIKPPNVIVQEARQ